MANRKISTSADIDTTKTAASSHIKTTVENGEQPEPKKPKDRRVQLLVLPDEWDKFQSFAHLVGSNPNKLIGGYIHEMIEQYAARIEAYEKERDDMQKALNLDKKE